MSPVPFRAGFAALIGRPNVGKSTLLNRIIGEPIAITSPKPQTTRNRILGVLTKADYQVALLDTPGVHHARGELNRYMVDLALGAISDVEVVVMLIDAAVDSNGAVEIGEANRFLISRLEKSKKPVILAINKIDLIEKPHLLSIISTYSAAFPFAEIIPLSALEDDGTDVLLKAVVAHLPESEPLFPPDVITDQAERQIVAEYVRERILKNCRQEVPYASAVVIEEFDESDRGEGGTVTAPRGLVRISASICVERESQKAIVIGKGGAMLKKIGSEARRSIERLLGSKVFLALEVRVEPRWSESRGAMAKMGYGG